MSIYKEKYLTLFLQYSYPPCVPRMCYLQPVAGLCSSTSLTSVFTSKFGTCEGGMITEEMGQQLLMHLCTPAFTLPAPSPLLFLPAQPSPAQCGRELATSHFSLRVRQSPARLSWAHYAGDPFHAAYYWD